MRRCRWCPSVLEKFEAVWLATKERTTFYYCPRCDRNAK